MLSNGRLLSPLKTPEQIRLAWRRAIQDQIMLNKIEKLSTISEGMLKYLSPGVSMDSYCYPITRIL